jgi:hypothetical protein
MKTVYSGALLRYEMRNVVRGRKYEVMQVRLISRDVLPTFLIRDISHMIGPTLTELTSIYWCLVHITGAQGVI